jgi:hypothetical protein
MLPEPLHSVIVGSLLGDACLERNGRHWRLRFDHGWREEAYAWWKFRLLHTIAASTPRWIMDGNGCRRSSTCGMVL